MGSEETPFHFAGSRLRADLRVQPGASRTAIDGLGKLADGGVVLMLRVTAPAEGNKANEAAIKLLAKAWGLPKSSLSIAVGNTTRRKSLQIDGDPAELMPLLFRWLEELPPLSP